MRASVRGVARASYAAGMNAPAHIIVVEDEAAIAAAVIYALQAEGWQVEHLGLGSQALVRLQAGGVDLVVLDVGLPDISGLEVCRQLRRFSQIPVLFLTARNEEVDRVLGLELGGDDYLGKPFSPRELVARVRARLRRPALQSDEMQQWQVVGQLQIDRQARRVRYGRQLLELTRYEYLLLQALAQRPGAILSRAQLMDRIWDAASDSADRTVDTHIKTLRGKLRSAGADEQMIRTHRGLGYALEG